MRSLLATVAAWTLALAAAGAAPASSAAGPMGPAGGAGAASAPGPFHTALEAAYPAQDSLHQTPVSQVRLRYTTAVQRELSAITVMGPEGELPTTPVDTVAGSAGREIGVRFEAPLPSGDYTVEWRTAGPDSHVIRGSYSFAVERPEPVPVDTSTAAAPGRDGDRSAPELAAQSGGTAEGGWGPGGITLNWLFLLSVVGMVGVVAFRTVVLGRFQGADGLEPVGAALARRLTGLGWAAVILALGVVPFRLFYQAAQVAGPDGSTGAAITALLGQPWGSSWLLETAAVALFLVGLLLERREGRGRIAWMLAGVAAVLMALVPALVGHSGGAGTAAVVADALHVLAAGIWAGGLLCLVLAGIPAAAQGRRDGGEAPALPVVVAAFSPMALTAVGLLVASGAFGALQHVALGELLSTSYGQLLSLKVLAALAAFSLGFYNWRVVRPQLPETPRPSLIRIPAAFELMVALGVLALTAALIVTAKP